MAALTASVTTASERPRLTVSISRLYLAVSRSVGNVPYKGFGLRHINMFWSLAQARVVIGDLKADYNHRR